MVSDLYGTRTRLYSVSWISPFTSVDDDIAQWNTDSWGSWAHHIRNRCRSGTPQESYQKVRVARFLSLLTLCMISAPCFKIARYFRSSLRLVIVTRPEHLEDIRKATDDQLSFLDTLDQVSDHHATALGSTNVPNSRRPNLTIPSVRTESRFLPHQRGSWFDDAKHRQPFL